jgi:hypothetical protein
VVDRRRLERVGDALMYRQVLDGPRAALGPPWTKEHRVAFPATIVAD